MQIQEFLRELMTEFLHSKTYAYICLWSAYSKNRNKDYCIKGWHQFCQYWWVYVDFENGFAYWENSGNYHPENIIKISEICKKSIFARDSLQLSHCFAVHSNFTYNSEASNFMKLYFETLLEILSSSKFISKLCFTQFSAF